MLMLCLFLLQDKLFPYAEENVKDFLTNQWEEADVKEAIAALRKLALEDKENSVDGVVAIPGEVCPIYRLQKGGGGNNTSSFKKKNNHLNIGWDDCFFYQVGRY